MAKRLIRVIGYTEKGIEVVGEFMYGIISKGTTTYYVADHMGIIHECINCKEK